MNEHARQLDLFTAPIRDTTSVQAMTFEEFDAANPHVYEALRDLALVYVDRGRTWLSMQFLFGILRHRHIQTEGGGGFTLNNNYGAKYSRKLMEEEPRLAGIFRVRERRK